MNTIPSYYHIHSDLVDPIRSGAAVVALESAVITHGLPYPENFNLAQSLEEEVRQQGAAPATIGLLNGKIMIGLTSQETLFLAQAKNARKISRRDFSPALFWSEPGGTTVAGTLIAARTVGIRVFATGGIGGVHRGAPFDISADLPELSRSPLIVVCAGAKSILDLPATLEYLETMGVLVIGYKTREFPAFFSRESGLDVPIRVENAEEIAQMARIHWSLGIESALLVVNPPPEDSSIPYDQIDKVIRQAVGEAEERQIHGAALTPYLLSRVSHLTGGESLKSNLALLRNNARLAAEISLALSQSTRNLMV